MFTSDLFTLSEAATGFTGGTYNDQMPELSLSECVSAMPLSLLESQNEHLDYIRDQNNIMVEAAITAMSTNTALDVGAIQEASMEGLKTRAKATFERIRKFFRSIIAKLTQFIDKQRMSGTQLYAKYKDSDALKNTDKFSGMTYTGYKFSKNADLFPSAAKYETDVANLIAAAIDNPAAKPDRFANGFASVQKDSTEAKEAESIINSIKEGSPSERQVAFAKILTGASDLGENWVSDLKEELYGEKTELTYGTDFTVDSVAGALKNNKMLEAVKTEYIKVEQACGKYQTEVERMLANTHKVRGAAENNDQARGMQYADTFFAEYIKVINEAYAVVGKVKDIKFNFVKSQAEQAKALFAKMLSYKGKSTEEDASDADDFDSLDIDL